MKPGPLRLEPVFLDKAWAGEGLPEPLSTLLGAPPRVGEVRLASDRHHPTRVAEGPFKGWGLDEVVRNYPQWVCGEDASGGFPLVLKILSVGNWLSVQVHADDRRARELEKAPFGMSAAWHVLAAEEGAQIVRGLTRDADRERVFETIGKGKLIDSLEFVPVERGETFHILPGAIHGIGPGLTILEIQQPSDITYRFYDWDRPGLNGKMRELHVDNAVEVKEVTGTGNPARPERQISEDRIVTRLVEDPKFTLLSNSVTGVCEREGEGPWLIFVYHGCAEISCPGFDPLLVEPGQVWAVPAGAGGWRVDPIGEGVVFFEATV